MDNNWNKLCGTEFHIWKNETFSSCFLHLFVICPVFALFTVVCAYYVGKRDMWYLRISHHLWTINIRILISTALLVCLAVQFVLHSVVFSIQLWPVDYIHIFVVSLCWVIHIIYLFFLRTRLTAHTRGPILVILCWILTLCAAVLDFASNVLSEGNTIKFLVERYCVGISIALNVLYGFTLLPSGKMEVSTYEGFSVNGDENEPLLAGTQVRYGGFHEDSDPHMLGVASEGSNLISKLTLFWVGKLMKKGAKGLLITVDDLYDLPHALKAANIDAKIASFIHNSSLKEITGTEERYRRNKNSLLNMLNRYFGIEYYSIGLLKLLSDILCFCGPLLLNYVVTFLEEGNEPTSNGYYYAAGLCGVTLLNAFCSTQFSYLISCVGLKIRAAVITCLYRKVLSINSSTISTFDTGQIVNFMSTDADRVMNFCQSFHQFWSLPLQIAVALYLLYRQIGISFMAGVAFAVLLVPVNQLIASKIGRLSNLMMQKKDKRIKLMNEVLAGIRVVKMHSWEDVFSHKIMELRKQELKYLKKRKYLDAFCVYFWVTTPLLISVLTFTTYVTTGNKLSAAKAFTCLALFNILITPLNAFPWVLNGLMEAWISLRRLQKFIELPGFYQETYYSALEDPMNRIEINEGCFSWTSRHSHLQSSASAESLMDVSFYISGTRNFQLGPIDLTIKKGHLIGIVGSVGSGKSMLISAIIGDIAQNRGTISIAESDYQNGIGLVLQEPWIQQTTIQKNILFGKTFNMNRYKNVIEACALQDDLRMMPAGDETEVGDRGVTLSGGQRSRVALARAVYQDFDLYILDDPLSAVDAHVAEHIFNECILKFLRNKTRILSTHHTKFLSLADYVIVLNDGQIVAQGPPTSVLPFAASSLSIEYDSPLTNDTVTKRGNDLDEDNLKEENLGQLVQEEEQSTGSVKFHVYKSYWNAIGSCLSTCILLSFFFMQASRTASDWWLSFWVSCDYETPKNIIPINSTILWELWPGKVYIQQESMIRTLAETNSGIVRCTGKDERLNVTFSSEKGICIAGTNETNNLKFFLTVYGSVAIANSFFTLIRSFLYAYGGICAAVIIHNKLLRGIIKAPISFFDATPLGRVLNRFSTDVYNIDDSLPFTLNILLAQLFSLAGSLIITSYGLPWIILLLIPLATVYYFIQCYYRCTSRELKRLSSTSLSPVYAHFSETLNGQTTIRILGGSLRFHRENSEKLDKNQQARFATTAASQWLNLRLQLIGVAIVTGVAFLGVVQYHISTVDPGLVGLALSYALSVTSLLSGVVTYFTETEKEMISVERAIQYIEGISSEDFDGIQPPFAWPTHGVISFINVSLQYRHNMPYALRNVTFETKSGEKLGIVGRTGSGKSSLFQILFRMVEINSGEIYIDGVNIKRLNLKELRSHLSVIPQDPFLFSGSVRENIDPKGLYSDQQLKKALHSCHLDEEVYRLGGLDSSVGEKGQLLSAGQRQLLCLARALLCKSRILCLDEATASVDHRTDLLIQQTIRSAFRNMTILIIAHRVETVLDSDRVLVMRDGEVAEFDKPSVLLENSNSYFSRLVHAGR